MVRLCTRNVLYESEGVYMYGPKVLYAANRNIHVDESKHNSFIRHFPPETRSRDLRYMRMLEYALRLQFYMNMHL